MDLTTDADRPSILSYLHDPEAPPYLITTFFRAAIDYADALPWRRLQPASHLPILLEFSVPARRLAMILRGEALGLALVEEMPEESGPASPALTTVFAG